MITSVANSIQDYISLLERTLIVYQLATGTLVLVLIGLLVIHARARIKIHA